MVIQTRFIPKKFDAVTVWPFIFIRPENAKDDGLITHELVHYREQKEWLVLPWLLAYGLSKRFRLAAEVRGYKAQIAAGTILPIEAAFYLTQYGLNLTMTDALKLLQ